MPTPHTINGAASVLCRPLWTRCKSVELWRGRIRNDPAFICPTFRPQITSAAWISRTTTGHHHTKKISGYGYFQGMSIDHALQSTCNMGMGNRPDLIEISCHRWSITVSFWCPQTKQDPTCPRVIYMAEH